MNSTSIHDTGFEAHEALRQENIKLNEHIAELEALNNVVSAMSRINAAEAGKNAALEENKGLLVAIRELEAQLKAVLEILTDAPEINPSNYDHDEVCELNAKMIEAFFACGGVAQEAGE